MEHNYTGVSICVSLTLVWNQEIYYPKLIIIGLKVSEEFHNRQTDRQAQNFKAVYGDVRTNSPSFLAQWLQNTGLLMSVVTQGQD